MLGVMPASDRDRWDARHRAVLDAGEAPRPAADWLVAHAGLLPPAGRALDVACGLGRNALWLAERGLEVDAVDVSGVAVEAVLARARARGVPVRAVRRDVEAEGPPEGPYDVVVDVAFLVRALVPALCRVLAPGGLLLFDTFVADEGPGPVRGPRDPAFVLGRGELAGLLQGLDVLELREDRPAPGEHARARLVGRRR
jgi:SAM-dependent methyltransferase